MPAVDLWKTFERLADDVEDRLKRPSAEHLSQAAEAALQALASELAAYDRAAYLQTLIGDAGHTVTQIWPNDYGDPTFTVVRRRQFRVEVIFWDQAFNPPHDHISCGAFLALHGHRLNRDLFFDTDYSFSDTVKGGTLKPGDCTYMCEGDTHYIQPEMIHDMFWIDLPVTTVAIRCESHPKLLSGPPRSYLAGGLATVRPRFRKDATLNTLRRGVKLMVRLDQTIDASVVDQLARRLPLGDYIYLMSDNADLGEAVLQDLLSAMPPPDSDEGKDVVDKLRASIPDLVRRDQIQREIHSHDLGTTRLVLGFLWLGQDRVDAVEIMRRREVDSSAVSSAELRSSCSRPDFAAAWEQRSETMGTDSR